MQYIHAAKYSEFLFAVCSQVPTNYQIAFIAVGNLIRATYDTSKVNFLELSSGN